MNDQKQHKHSRNILGHKNKTSNTFSFLKLPSNILTKNQNTKTLTVTHNKVLYSTIIKLNLQMYNTYKKEFEVIKINDLIESKNCNLVAIFKDYLISDYIDEFLRRFYKIKESKSRIPKFSDYYKNYLKFFCKPTFSDFFANDEIQGYGEAKAEIYYKKNYAKKNNNKNNNYIETIFNTSINESIENVIKDTKEFISTINTQETINLTDKTILEINNLNKNSNNDSISSLLKCFSSKEKKTKGIIYNLNIKKIKKYEINNSNKPILDKEKNNKNSPNKSNNKFKPNSTIPTSSRNYTGNKVNLKHSHNKYLKTTRIESSTSQNNLSSNRTKNKSKSKDFSNSKVINIKKSNSNFSRNKSNNPLYSPTAKHFNNRIFLTSNSPKKNHKKKSLKQYDRKQGKNHLNLNKYNENLNLKDIMKLTLQIYNDKSKIINSSKKNNNNNINNNNNNYIRHQHTRSSPTINNFNININNHICFQNSNNNINSKNNKNTSSKNNSPLSRNKENTFIKVNTCSKYKINPYSSMASNYNLISNTNNDIDLLLKKNFFSSFNSGKNDKKDNNLGLNTMRQVHHYNIQSKYSFNNNETLLKNKKEQGYFINQNLKNKIQNYKMNSINKTKDKLNFPSEKIRK